MKSGRLYNPIAGLLVLALIIYALIQILPWLVAAAAIFFIIKYSIVLYKKDSKTFLLVSKVLITITVIVSILVYCSSQSSEREFRSKQAIEYIERGNIKATVTQSIIYNHINDSLNYNLIDYTHILKTHLSNFNTINEDTYYIYYNGDLNGYVCTSIAVSSFDECLTSLKKSFNKPHFDSIENDTLDFKKRTIKWEFEKLHILMCKDSGYYTSCFVAVFNPEILSKK